MFGMSTKVSISLWTIVAVTACAPDWQLDAKDGSDSETASLVEGSPEAVGMVAFLNDPGTTFEMLLEQVSLNLQAADSIVDFRNGADGAFGTDDDQLFQGLGQVADLEFVEWEDLAALMVYAEDMGFVPEGDDVLGTWDGHTFTVNQAGRVLSVVNQETERTLDEELGLDRRAVEGILEARPLTSVYALSKVYFVGEHAMGLIAEYAEDVYPH